MPYRCDFHEDHPAAVLITLLNTGDVLAMCTDGAAMWALSFIISNAAAEGVFAVDLFKALLEQAQQEAGETPEPEQPQPKARKTSARRKGTSTRAHTTEDPVPETQPVTLGSGDVGPNGDGATDADGPSGLA